VSNQSINQSKRMAYARLREDFDGNDVEHIEEFEMLVGRASAKLTRLSV
jgi:hypothetical protein